jgi:hypothetical protein
MFYMSNFRIYQEVIDLAWENTGKNLPIISSEPIVVAIYVATDLELQYYAPIKGMSTFVLSDILRRKAEVIQWTGGLRYSEANEYAKNDGVKLLGSWLPIGKGTEYEGAAPVKIKGEFGDILALIVAVSGQDHRTFDQPFADAIACELEYILQDT